MICTGNAHKKNKNKVRNLVLTILLISGLAGCAAGPGRYIDNPPSLEDIQAAFEATGRALISKLKQLMNRSPEVATVDFQTAITLESVRMPPRHVADRGVFYQEADRLDEILNQLPEQHIPRDSAVLSLLGNLASGNIDQDYFLNEYEHRQVVSMCGPSHVQSSITHLSEEEDMLRQACFKWLLGDAPKSRALFYYLKSGNKGQRLAIGDTAFETFMLRLKQTTGIDLMAHRHRLAVPGDTLASKNEAPAYQMLSMLDRHSASGAIR